jgi:SAM-dependent methyltransferase
VTRSSTGDTAVVPPEPDVYTHGHHDAVLRSHRWRTARNSAAYLLPHLRAGLSLLDVGCGPGTLTVDLADRVAPGRALGIDPAPAAVAAARAHAADEGPATVEFAEADLRTLGEADGAFDVVHAHQVLQHLRDPVGALRAMAALARPGSGIVAARDADYAAMSWAPADARLDRWAALYQAVGRRNGAEPDAGRHLPRWARLAGLRDVAYTTSTWTFAAPDDRAWWSGTWAERTVASSLADQACAYGLATRDELAAIADGWRAWAADDDAVFTVVHGEIIARV